MNNKKIMDAIARGVRKFSIPEALSGPFYYSLYNLRDLVSSYVSKDEESLNKASCAAILAYRPLTVEALKYVPTFGELRVKKYGADVVGMVAKCQQPLTDQQLFEKLALLRTAISRKRGCKAYSVMTNKALKLISSSRPYTKEQMLAISGIGEITYNKSGDIFLGELIQLRSI